MHTLDKSFDTKAIQSFEELSSELIKHSDTWTICFATESLIKKDIETILLLVNFGTSTNDSLSAQRGLYLTHKPQPSFNKQFDLLIEDLNTQHSRLRIHQLYLLCQRKTSTTFS